MNYGKARKATGRPMRQLLCDYQERDTKEAQIRCVGGDTRLSPEPSDTGTWALQVEKQTRAVRGTATSERQPQRSRIGRCAECCCKGTETEIEMDVMARYSHAEALGTLTGAVCGQGKTETGK